MRLTRASLETLAVIILSICFKKWLWLLFVIPVIARELLYNRMPKKNRPVFSQIFWIPELAIILGASVYCIYRGMNDPFLYFRF